MTFYTHPGLIGKVYAPPVPREASGKHSCPDCFNCQVCGNERCALCLARKPEPDGLPGMIIKGSKEGIDFPDIEQKP